MRTYKYKKDQLCVIHGLHLDSAKDEVEQARQEWHSRCDAQLRELAFQENERFDAGETAIIALQLEHMFSKVYDRKYPEYKARQLVPTSSEAHNGAETWAYEFWDMVGMAKIISDWADDLPRVSAFAQKFTGRFISMGAAYDYDLQELRASALSGNNLQMRKAMMARRAHESKHDAVFAFGDPETNSPGFVNNANVPVISAGITGDWLGAATPQQILEDLRILERSGPANTFDVFSFDTLVLPIAEFQKVAGTELSVDNNSTVLEQFMRTSPYIRNVESWHKLDTANTAGTGPRMIMYKRDPDVLELVESQSFEQLPPQVKNLSWVVNTHSRIGGVKIVFPLGMSYSDIE